MKIMRLVTIEKQVLHYLIPLIKYVEKKDVELIIVGSNVEIYRDDYPWVKFISLNIERKPKLVKDLIALLKLTKLIHTEKPDILHSTFPKPGLLGAISGCLCRVKRRYHTFTGQMWNDSRYPKLTATYWADVVISKLNSNVLTDGEDQSKFLYESGVRYKGGLIPYLGDGAFCGIDYSSITSVVKKNPSDIITFTYLARKTKEKGCLDIIDAFSRVHYLHPNTKLLFIGPDESNGLLDEKLARKDLSGIQIISQVECVQRYLLESDVFCLPSYREGFSTILLEAAAYGIPCIGYDTVGVAEPILKCNSGEVVKLGDIDAFSEKMLCFAKNEKKRNEYSESGRVNARIKFDSYKCLNDLFDFYHSEIKWER
ncbi:hypothetical protein CWB96_11075 [Pseudoalteromonas citrea]|uniref:Glycosyltransferase family 1 protein n=1 Tax=Pseudoalteromonas citrea TaxID=43655 RepID=A0A5S3XPB7_9GAMM|nr:glycosyltransferase [Pseudoalteromonas citrea]TMP45719.1 hypothetical protein CWB97_03720 [Pseudoalteromonas citrea]TMP59098.1 hypothetical protein CWB96_11075 [Pseudoalteromonas citrea]